MLKSLKLKNVGPMRELEMDLAPRFNILAGDNGLGKTFILDAIWWIHTNTWSGNILRPYQEQGLGQLGQTISEAKKSFIQYQHKHTSKHDGIDAFAAYDKKADKWLRSAYPFQHNPGLILYVKADGNFGIFDPYRDITTQYDSALSRKILNYISETANTIRLQSQIQPDLFEIPTTLEDSLIMAEQIPFTHKAVLLDQSECWHGAPECQGLVQDVRAWQLELSEAFKFYKNALATLSPSDEEHYQPGTISRISTRDPIKYPTIFMPYGQNVPVTQVSAGLKRILSVVYMLSWMWSEHLEICRFTDQTPIENITILFDEPEAHLHPKWQRKVLPALLSAIKEMTSIANTNVQIVAATHSPMVLASLEPYFNEDTDDVWELDLVRKQIQLSKFNWSRRGDANNWLTSDVFDLKHARSFEAEQAIEKATQLMDDNSQDNEAIEIVHQKLQRALGDRDRFWRRWLFFKEERGEA